LRFDVACTNLFHWNKFGTCTKTCSNATGKGKRDQFLVTPRSTQHEKRPVPGHIPRMPAVPDWKRWYNHLNGTTRPRKFAVGKIVRFLASKIVGRYLYQYTIVDHSLKS